MTKELKWHTGICHKGSNRGVLEEVLADQEAWKEKIGED